MVEVLNFYGRTLFVSPSEVKSYESLLLSFSIPTEEEIANKSKKTKPKAVGKGTISLTVPLMAALGVRDILGEHEAWLQLADTGVKAPLYILGRRLGDRVWMLTTVGLADPMAGTNGVVYEARLQLGFDGELPVEEEQKKTGTGKDKPPGYGEEEEQLVSAFGVDINTGQLRRIPGMYTKDKADEMFRETLLQYRIVTGQPQTWPTSIWEKGTWINPTWKKGTPP